MKRFMRTFLALALIFAMTAAGILAPVKVNAAQTASGTCGDNLTWVLDANGTLTISGTGAMTGSPWADYAKLVKKIVIEDGVTSISEWAFDYCVNLTSVTIPNSVTKIETGAFGRCIALTSIEIPSSITDIPVNAFMNCESLTSVTIPESVTTFSPNAFNGCSALVTLDIPKSVTTIGAGAFRRCSSLKSIVLPEGVKTIPFWCFQDCSALESVTIPVSVNEISPDSFARCSSLVEVVFPEGCAWVNSFVFSDCSSLTTVYLPESLTGIHGSAFSGCTALETVYYGGSKAQLESITVYSADELMSANWVYNYKKLRILSQPTSVGVSEGEVAKATVQAQGNDLTYKWYYKNPGASKFSLSTGVTGNSYKVVMNEDRDGREVYCCIYDKDGNMVQTDTVKLSLKRNEVQIVTQPVSAKATEGKYAEVKVGATGDGLTYKWYYKDQGASKYTLTTSFTGNTYKIQMNEARNGRYVFCRVYDKYGNMVQTKTVKLSLADPVKITTQPVSAKAPAGKTAEITVGATGDGLTYKWYYKDKGASSYTLTTSFTGNTYKVQMNNARDGRQVLCRVYDKYGNVVQTNTVKLSMEKYVQIVTQPTSVTVAEGEMAVVTVKATGDGLTYRWYYKDAGASSYTYTASYKTNTYKVAMNDARNGRQLLCRVYDQYGNVVQTKTVVIKMR